MAKMIDFSEEQQVVGYVETHTGSLAILDGVIESELKQPLSTFVAVDVGLDKKRVPVIATKQGGRRYLLIALDAAEDITPLRKEKVEVEEKVTPNEDKKKDATKK